MNKKLILKTLYYVIVGILLVFLMIPKKVHREGMIDSEKLFYTLLGNYPSYHFQENLVKETNLSVYGTVKASEISNSEIDAKVDYLQQNGWRKVFSKDETIRLCYGSQNVIYISKWRKDSILEQDPRFKGKVKFSFSYAYRGNSVCE